MILPSFIYIFSLGTQLFGAISIGDIQFKSITVKSLLS